MIGYISSRMLLHYTHVTSGAARKAVEILDNVPIPTPTVTQERDSDRERVYRT
jgi:hypothetical protein